MNIAKILQYTTILLLLISGMIGAYFWGKDNGTQTSTTTFIQNYEAIKAIAELSALEVKGSTEYTKNDKDTNSWYAGISNFLTQNNVHYKMPYIAKYGHVLKDSNFTIQEKEKEVVISLPPAQLLSCELVLDKTSFLSQKGLLVPESDATLQQIQKIMYTTIRKELENNTILLDSTQTKTCDLLKKYFIPTDKKVTCRYAISITKNKE